MRQTQSPARMGKREAQRAIKRFVKSARSAKSDCIVKHPGIPSRFWDNKRHLRKAADLVHFATGKRYGLLNDLDFMQLGFSGAVQEYGGAYAVVLAAGRADIRPWERRSLQKEFWSRGEFRVDALGWVIKKMKRSKRSLSEVLTDYPHLSTLFYGHYNGDFDEAMEEAKAARLKDSQLINCTVSKFVGVFK